MKRMRLKLRSTTLMKGSSDLLERQPENLSGCTTAPRLRLKPDLIPLRRKIRYPRSALQRLL